MADGESKIYGGRWQVVRELGRGGQGVVYEVRRHEVTNVSESVNKVQHALRNITATVPNKPETAMADLINGLRALVKEETPQRGALKELLPIDEAINAATAIQRMEQELDALQSVDHPALIKVLDSALEEQWFVTEYFDGGTLADKLDRYKGKALQALQAFRPIVEALSAFHKTGRVHRDIKPDNVFVADDGHLVLGDCGLAIKMEKRDRLTLTFENVGTRDYQPPWSYGMRLDEVRPTFDVFSLGKLLWAMVSGRPRFPLWYFRRREHDLLEMFPDDTAVPMIDGLLAKCVAQDEDLLQVKDAEGLLAEVDKVLSALTGRPGPPSQRHPMTCRFCGTGTYSEISGIQNDSFANPADRRRSYRCDSCGHLESFFWRNGEPPPAWRD